MHRYPDQDDALLSGFTNKEKPAFTAIYHRYYGGLHFFACRFVSSETAEDILSESFIRLWQSPATFGSLAQLHQWLRVTVRNACLNQLRSQQQLSRQQAALLEMSDEAAEELYSRDRIYAELHTRIISEIGKMPAQQQNILKMFFLQEMSNSDIAAKLNISVQAVKNQKVTALKALRTVFSREELLMYAGIISAFLE